MPSAPAMSSAHALPHAMPSAPAMSSAHALPHAMPSAPAMSSAHAMPSAPAMPSALPSHFVSGHAAPFALDSDRALASGSTNLAVACLLLGGPLVIATMMVAFLVVR